MENTENQKSFLSNKKVVVGFIALLIIVVGAGTYFYTKANSDPQKIAKKELDKAIYDIGKLIVLPEGETPTLATVSDPEKLKDQPFFANAKKGYKVLIYTNAKKAIIYDPVANKIIDIAPINTESPPENP